MLRRGYLPVAIAIFTFLLTLIIGLLARVTWTTALGRSSLAALVLGGATFLLIKYLQKILPPAEEIAAAVEPALDLTLPPEIPPERLPKGVGEGEQKSRQETEFQPFVPRQIDPELEQLIRDDPSRAARIIKNMGLDP